jgi:hypothetical protein
MDTQPTPPGNSESNTGQLVGTISNTEILGTQQECRHRLVHRNATYAVTQHVTQNANLKIVRKTGSRKNKKQHAVGFEYIHTEANGGQLTVTSTAGARREQRDEFIAAHDGKTSMVEKGFCPHSARNRT